MRYRFLVAALLLTFTVSAKASTNADAVMQSMDRLLVAEARGFAGLAADEVRKLRKDFMDKLAVAKAAARNEHAQLSRGKTGAEIDRLLLARSLRAGLPAEVKREVEAAGGPARTMEQMDRITAEFAANVLEGSKSYASSSIVERAFAGIFGAAHARLLKRYCYLTAYVLTGAAASPTTYDACNRR